MNLTQIFTKINSKGITNLNVKRRTMKLLGGNLNDLGLDEEFLDITPRAQSKKERIDELDFIKIKNFCFVKVTVRRMKTSH